MKLRRSDPAITAPNTGHEPAPAESRLLHCGTDTIAVFDLDGTLTRNDTFRAFLLYFLKHRPSRVLRTLPLPIAILRHLAGHITNHTLKERFVSAMLGGEPANRVSVIAHDFSVRFMRSAMRPSIVARLRYHQDRRHRVLLATASPDCYVLQLAMHLGISEIVCTRLERDASGNYTGRLAEANCYGVEKLDRVVRYLGPRFSSKRIVYSDHASDWPLLEWADCGILVCPSTRLRKRALASGLEIIE